MKRTLKFIIAFLPLSLSFVSLSSNATICPPVDSIKRVSGEYQWVTTEPGWNGFFIAPTTGRGHSYKVKTFLNASWVKSYDAADSSGFIQCDYIGDFGVKKITNQAVSAPVNPNAPTQVNNSQSVNLAITPQAGGVNVTGGLTPGAPAGQQAPANQANQAQVIPVETTEYEIIRFTQVKSNGSMAPDSKISWTCKAVTTFPSEACTCYGNVEKCNFRMN